MIFNVYADLSRRLSMQERIIVSDALDSIVPGSGCLGSQGSPCDEVYFRVEAASLQEAREQALDFLNTMLEKLGSEIQFTLELTPSTST